MGCRAAKSEFHQPMQVMVARPLAEEQNALLVIFSYHSPLTSLCSSYTPGLDIGMEDAAELLEDCGSSELFDADCDGTEDNSNKSTSSPASHSLVLGSANRRSRRLEMQLVQNMKDNPITIAQNHAASIAYVRTRKIKSAQ